MLETIQQWCPTCAKYIDHQRDEAGGTVCLTCKTTGVTQPPPPPPVEKIDNKWLEVGMVVILIVGGLAIIAVLR